MAQVSSSLPPRPQPTRLYRWLVLLFISLAMFGNYYAYDALGPMADVLKNQLHFSDQNIGLLQSFYSIAPILTVLLGGFIIDRIGTRKSIFLFAVLCLIGSIITWATGVFWIMASGRLIFGMGAESLIVAVTTAIAKWFRGKELSFAFGINLMIARAGSWLAQNSPSWASWAYQSWQTPWLIAVVFASLCVAGAIVYWFMEIHADKRYELAQAGATDKIVFRDILHFGASYWYIVGLCFVFYSAIFPFQTFAVKLFMEAHGTTRALGGFLVSVVTTFAMFATPAFGLLVDKIGKRSLLMVFGSLLLIPVYLMLGYSHASLYIPMALQGIAFSLVPAVLWPSVAYIVGQEKLGTAYGLMTMLQNIGLAGFNYILGWANDHAHASAANPAGYHLMLQILTLLSFLGVLFAYLLRRRETGPHGHGLETITTKSATA